MTQHNPELANERSTRCGIQLGAETAAGCIRTMLVLGLGDMAA